MCSTIELRKRFRPPSRDYEAGARAGATKRSSDLSFLVATGSVVRFVMVVREIKYKHKYDGAPGMRVVRSGRIILAPG